MVVSLLLTSKAARNKGSIIPAWMLSRRCVRMVLMVSLSRCFFDVGANISSSKWTRSHQKGVEAWMDGDVVMVSIILAWIV